jgi:hypothetical protein
MEDSMKAAKKSQGIEDLLTGITGKDRIEVVGSMKCMTCNEPDTNFRNVLSRKEYAISGMCQKCQDWENSYGK